MIEKGTLDVVGVVYKLLERVVELDFREIPLAQVKYSDFAQFGEAQSHQEYITACLILSEEVDIFCSLDVLDEAN